MKRAMRAYQPLRATALLPDCELTVLSGFVGFEVAIVS